MEDEWEQNLLQSVEVKRQNRLLKSKKMNPEKLHFRDVHAPKKGVSKTYNALDPAVKGPPQTQGSSSSPTSCWEIWGPGKLPASVEYVWGDDFTDTA